MKKKTVSRGRGHERGQTIILVAISLISLLAMAALAIDVVTLYAARSETQRAADATALAAAKAISDSGFTTLLPTDPNYASAKLLAQRMSDAAIDAMINANPQVNLVAGTQPAAVPPHPVVNFSLQGNPRITVKMQVTTLPTFFARIWGNRTASVTASATAEAYNPANVPNFTPIAPKGVKPWLVANADPYNLGTPPFITATGAVEPGVTVTGEQFNLTADCQTAGTGCTLLGGHNPPIANHTTNQVDYVPAQVNAPSSPNPNVCPPCAGASDYEQSIECADVTTSYTALYCGGGVSHVQWDNVTVNPTGPTGISATGAECLIHASTSGPLQGQDTLAKPTPLFSAPMQITAQSGPQNGNVVTTSNSIVTIPIIDPATFQAGSPHEVMVVGFMQAFINWVQDGTGGTNPGDINITVLNIAGCSTTPNGANPVVGSGTSPVPVRLITPP